MEKLLESEIGEMSEPNDVCIKKWLGFIGFVIDGQQWELATALFRKIISNLSQNNLQSQSEKSLWEDVQFHWASVAANKMKDLDLTAAIIDEVIVVHANSQLNDSNRVSS